MRFLKRMLGTPEYHGGNTNSHHGQTSQQLRGLICARCKVSLALGLRFGGQPGSSL